LKLSRNVIISCRKFLLGIISIIIVLYAFATVNYAASNPFIGNTVKASVAYSITRCGPDGVCEKIRDNKQNFLTYVGNKGDVYAYDENKTGYVKHIGEHYRLSNADHVWLIRGNSLIEVAKSINRMGTDVMMIFTAHGNSCTFAMNLHILSPGSTLTSDIYSQTCEIIHGHEER
jgi:hypothetical protein